MMNNGVPRHIATPNPKAGAVPRPILILIGFLALMVILFVFGLSLDSSPEDDSDLKVVRRSLAEEENAYTYYQQATTALDWPTNAVDLLDSTNFDVKAAADIIEKNRETFAFLDKAAALPYCKVPEITGFDTPLPYVGKWRTLARLLAIKTRYLLANNQPDQALAVALQTIRIGDQMEDCEGGIIHYLVGCAVKGIGFSRLQEIIAAPAVATNLLSADSPGLTPNIAGLENAFRLEYQYTATALEDIRNGKHSLTDFDTGFGITVGSRRIPPPRFLLHVNRTKHIMATFNRAMITNASRPYALMDLTAIRAMENQHLKAKDILKPNPLGKVVAQMISMTGESMLKRKCREEAQGQAIRLLMALRRYQADHAALPETLQALVPTYLKAVPCDPYDGNPIRYSREKKIFWFVGSDLKDNDGSDLTLRPDPTPYDKVWEAEDVVFPIKP